MCDRVPFLSEGSPPPPTARARGPSRARAVSRQEMPARVSVRPSPIMHAPPLLLLSLARPRAASAPSRPIPSARLPGAPMREGAHPPHPPPARADARPTHVQSMLLSQHQCSSSAPPPFARRSQCADTVSRRRSDDRLVRAAARARGVWCGVCRGQSNMTINAPLNQCSSLSRARRRRRASRAAARRLSLSRARHSDTHVRARAPRLRPPPNNKRVRPIDMRLSPARPAASSLGPLASAPRVIRRRRARSAPPPPAAPPQRHARRGRSTPSNQSMLLLDNQCSCRSFIARRRSS